MKNWFKYLSLIIFVLFLFSIDYMYYTSTLKPNNIGKYVPINFYNNSCILDTTTGEVFNIEGNKIGGIKN